jgi:hypothetical protein
MNRASVGAIAFTSVNEWNRDIATTILLERVYNPAYYWRTQLERKALDGIDPRIDPRSWHSRASSRCCSCND